MLAETADPSSGLRSLSADDLEHMLTEVGDALNQGNPALLRGEVPPEAVWGADQLVSAGELEKAGQLIGKAWLLAQSASIDARIHTLNWLTGVLAVLGPREQARLLVSLNGHLVSALHEAANPNVYGTLVQALVRFAPQMLAAGQGEPIEPLMRVLHEHSRSDDGGLSGRQETAQRALSAIATPTVLKALLGEFQCGDKIRQSKATRALVACGEPAARALTELLEGAESVAIRLRAVSALKAIGNEAIPILTEKLHGNYPWFVKRNAVAVLRDVGGPQQVPLIAAQARHSDPRVRVEVMSALGKLGGNQAVETLIAGLNDREAAVREQAVVSLGNLRNLRALPALSALIGKNLLGRREASEVVQCAACAALGQIGDDGAAEALIKALKPEGRCSFRHSKSEAVRCAAAQALAAYPRADVRELLAAAAKDPNLAVRAAAGSALRALETGFSPGD